MSAPDTPITGTPIPGTPTPGTATHGTTANVTPLPTALRSPDEEGSLVTEYGLLAVVAATIAGVIISWASNGALVSLFNALLRHARGLVGA
jgi:Flp pilus assembly pilin Flp